MKKTFTLILLLFMLLPLTINAQNASKIVPVKVYWLIDGKMYDLRSVQSGIRMPNKIELAVVLQSKPQLQGQKFEFKWYHRGPTRDYLTNSIVKKVQLKSGEKQVILKAGTTNLKRGWWKVQVNAYIDRKPLAYAKKTVFWIKII